MVQKIKSWFSVASLIGLIVGAIGGFVYYFLVGCQSGSCQLWSNPWLSIIWGALLGYLLGDIFTKKKKVGENPEDEK